MHRVILLVGGNESEGDSIPFSRPDTFPAMLGLHLVTEQVINPLVRAGAVDVFFFNSRDGVPFLFG